MSLHMIQLGFDVVPLFEWSKTLKLPRQDLGYVAHAALRDCFGDAAPQPFMILEGQSRFVNLLGYGPEDRETLAQRAREQAEPVLHRALSAVAIESKEMPPAWRVGSRFGFRAMVCPVRRGRDDNGKVVERDVFLSEARRRPKEEKITREEVYASWLADELARENAAELVSASLKSFRFVRPARVSRNGDRSTRRLGDRPEVRLEGALEVKDSDGFAKLLTRGLGRHRAFGYGMLLLRPYRA